MVKGGETPELQLREEWMDHTCVTLSFDLATDFRAVLLLLSVGPRLSQIKPL